jgi:hypothetical protein
LELGNADISQEEVRQGIAANGEDPVSSAGAEWNRGGWGNAHISSIELQSKEAENEKRHDEQINSV